ncbi:MAG: hypothetical protein A2275_14655 [Bacteroidetes bacterium RIFOXYA12_FULL_35_11]|nr:MAG: hypothetical protein A2X01_11725 [Bacteroidetes bacterium GWF2_35_48]OFY80049.1 MAG: hypothetical protein A2275_14655 [Bacteroidetes bacterium RIFOXYA12_FULL_35_11]
MKNVFIILIYIIFLSSPVYSQIVFSEGFESGSLPSGWSNVPVSGAINWSYTTGGNSGHPATAYDGIKNALFFYGSYGSEKTKLVTPPVDLSSVTFPVLKFWHTQDAWGVDQDKLNVYYKTSAGGEWVLLASYTNEIINWTEEIISLPNPSATYYLAFEAQTGYGYGVCIDKISIEQTPAIPKNLTSILFEQASEQYVLQGSFTNPVFRIKLNVEGNSGILNLNNVTIKSLNTNDNTIITNGVKLFFTTTPDFSPVTQIGIGQNFIAGVCTFSSLTYDLPAGQSYLWITYDVSATAPDESVFDAYFDANAVDIGGSTFPSVITSPVGNRILIETIFQDNFETDNGWTLTGEFERSAPLGLGGNYINPDPDFAYSGMNVLGTDLSGIGFYPGDYEPWIVSKAYTATSPLIDCSFYTNVKLRFFRFLNIENWDKAYIEISNDAGSNWNTIWMNPGQIVDETWGLQEYDLSYYADRKDQIKIRFALGTTDGTNHCSGWNIDDVILTGNFYSPEVAVTQLVSPTNGCFHTSTDTVKIKILNFAGAPTEDSLRLCYSFDGGINYVYDTLFQSIPMGDSIIFTFRQTVDLSNPATHNVIVATLAPDDKNTSNDTLRTTITSSPQFSIPYFSDFESGQDGWYGYGVNTSWAMGLPSGSVINSAASGVNVWCTNLSGNYNNNELSALYSPCFDFTGIANPVIEFKLWYLSEPDFDGAALQYSTNNGTSWGNVGAYNDAVNWYNFDTISSNHIEFGAVAGWSYLNQGWKKVKHALPPVIANNPDVRFRLVFGSNEISVNEGFAFDDVAIYDNIPDIGVASQNTPISACSLSNAESISITIENFGTSIFNIGDTLLVTMLLNGTLQCTDSIILPTAFLPGSEITHIFSNNINMQAPGNYNFDFYTSLSGDANNTNNLFSVTIANYGFPTVSIQGISASYCNNLPNQNLTATPIGGTFDGDGIISGTIFSPSSFLNAGNYFISYSYTDGFGCSSTDTAYFEIYETPDVSFAGLDAEYCFHSTAMLPYILSGTPAGGNFIGNGITGNSFHPSIIGSYSIIYTFTSTESCTNSDTQLVTVHPLPIVSFSGLSEAYCEDADFSVLSGFPAGGIFNGTGIQNDTFYVSVAETGQHVISYSFSDIYNCSATASDTTIIYPLPLVSFTGLDASYCKSTDIVELTGTPMGGTFSGTDIFNNEFTPATEGVHLIQYTYTSPENCTNTYSQNVTVFELPAVNFTGLEVDYCMNEASSVLTGSPIGGIFSGSGIVNTNEFNPQIADAGAHTVFYNYTDTNGCSSEAANTTTIYPVPDVFFSGLESSYCTSTISDTLTGIPTGGTFSGLSFSDSIFTPTQAGSFQISYFYTNIYGCSDADTQAVNIYETPVASFTGLAPHYCPGAEPDTLSGFPAGGIFSGNGITDTVFSPMLADTGMQSITYVYTNNDGCSSSESHTTLVLAEQDVQFTGLNASFCTNSADVNLFGIPSGGIFTGQGISGTLFSPSSLMNGIYEIIYSFTNNYGCINADTQQTSVYTAPVVSFTGLDTSYCLQEEADTLIGFPTGGFFAGSGLNGTIFAPLAIGNYTFSYHYTDNNNCSNSDTQQTIVYDIPYVNFTGLADNYCLNSDTINLTGIPENGAFTGNGISGTVFHPDVAGTGFTGILYSYTDSNNCTNTMTHYTTVHENPEASYTGLDSSYCANGEASVLNGSPAGGIYSGGNMSGNVFIPSISGSGTISITYIYTDTFGCSGSETKSTNVYAQPVTYVEGIDSSYCEGAPPVLLSGYPDGGTFSGQGMDENIFKPELLDAGNYSIFYFYTDSYNCSDTTVSEVTIEENPEFSFTTDSLKINFPYTIHAGEGFSAYLWNNGSSAENITVTAAGWYSCTVFNEAGCTASDSVYLSKIDGVEELSIFESVKIYPNPATDLVFLDIMFKYPIGFNFEISDYLGKTILVSEVEKTSRYFASEDISKLSSGIYYLRVRVSGASIHRKIVIDR